ncbi:flagellar hook-basal body complex protein [Bradyrhizobium sp. dw_411]|uniref:flagellar hook-basal body complex protein n=1 Tax=Bradyrhizobium sp. dw_411 TaxID=2720082 RepID=UPI001BCC6DC0|nr:flagellar hook-basal body complex protein [Bradyrhizobium sp. dw_411]
MGIFDALNTAVGGLQAQSFALQNISGNIANASTVGYKGIDTSFEDLIPDSLTPNKQVAGGVTAFAQQTITTQGTVSASTVATNIAINGDGFFSVQQPSGITDNVPTFGGVVDYTRRGDFQINDNGNLVNGAGYYLMGVAVDPKTGNPLGNVPTVLQFQNNFIPAQATTAIQYAANLPTVPVTASSPTGAPKSIVAAGGLNPDDFTTNPTVFGTAAPPINANITGTAVNNQMTTPAPISGATLLSGATGTDSLASGFAVNDTITVDGTTITFVASGATGNQLNVTDNMQALLNKISSITGGPASISGASPGPAGLITIGTGTTQDLAITSSNTAALAGLGLGTGTISKAMAPGTNTGSGVVVASDLTAFTSESISGGAVTAYNSAGTPVNLQLRWAMTDSATLGPGHQNTWNLFYQTDTTATGGQTAWVNAGQNFVFNSNGNLTSPSGSGITIPSVQVDGQSLGSVQFNVSSGALTQFATTGGTATVGTVSQNGFAAGQLQSVAINNSGLVVGTFSNGQNIDLASVTLSHFNGTNYLKALDGGAYAVTDQSGPAIEGASGTISGSSLEGSNTDIADEFTKLIVTQQAYSANTKVITTANDMVQDLLNVLR